MESLSTLSDTFTASQTIEIEGLTNIVTPSRADIFAVHKVGRFAQIYINNLSYSSAFSSDTKVAKVNHTVSMLTRFMLYSNASTYVTGFINQYGELYLNNYSANTLLYGSITFMISD